MLIRLFSILTHKKQGKGKCILQMFPVFCHYIARNPAKNFDYNRSVFMYLVNFDASNYVTPSNSMEMKIDVTKQIKMTLCWSM